MSDSIPNSPPSQAIKSDSETTVTKNPESNPKCQTAIQSLSTIVTTTTIPSTISNLLNDESISTAISTLLLRPDSGAGDNKLCRWLYDTFQSSEPSLQLLVLRFVPLIAGLYLSRVPLRQSQAGFEAVLLALYAHETTSRAGQAITVNIPDLSHPSIYHESTTTKGIIILGHCLLGLKKEDTDLSEAANKACQRLYLRSLHDINPKVILSTGSLLRLREMALDPKKNQFDHTDISNDAVLVV